MFVIESIVGAVISWLVPKILEAISKPAPTDKLSILHWCVALCIGGGIGGFISGLLGTLGLDTWGGLGNWTAFGVVLGISQWVVLRAYLGIGPSWAVMSALGWSTWSYFQASGLPEEFGWLGWVVVGFAVGVLQWLLLMRRVRRHVLWIPANSVAWAVAGAVGVGVGTMLLSAEIPFPIAWVLGWATVGLVGAIVLGLSLRFMPIK